VATELDNIELRPARRRFLKGAAALATTLIAPGVMLYKTGQASSDTVTRPRWGLLIDTNALSEADIDACVSACQREHGWKVEPGSTTDAQWIRKVKLTDAESGHQRFLPMMCQHCENPPCVDVCPTGASFKRDDGIVLVNKHTCIGCRYCMMACPYKARSFIHESLKDQLPVAPRGKGTVESCTLCVHRIDRDGANAVPACAQAVNHGEHKAILFGDLNDPHSEISDRLRELGAVKLRADMGLDPGVRYQGL
jgi:molybdopterin-containing oxidoreductase family iron-sulfur binding subunit